MMTASTVADLYREAFLLIVLMVCVLVLPSLLVGLLVSLFQAATQINEQTLGFLPRLLTTFATIMIAGPWMITRLTDFTHNLVARLPELIG